ncbi:MAG: C10 family peptidase [Bacteroidales bacterium]|jgi:hypothetical protein
MKKTFSIILAIIISLSVFCNPISKKDAVTTANTFIKSHNLKLQQVSSDNIVYTSTFDDNNPAFYVFSFNNDGFIIVSAQDFTYPILGYSENVGFDPNNIPDNLKEVLLGYTQEIEFGVKNNFQVNSYIQKVKDDQINNSSKDVKSVEPLLGEIQWDQRPFYNDMCPIDPIWGVRCPVGCAATAMVQIMRYWEHPSQGEGSHSYNHNSYGNLSADFTCTYDWANMPKPTLTGPNTECAKASYHCAVSIDMNFSPNGSGAYLADVGSALKTYFKYDPSLNVKNRSSYTESVWKQMIKEELDNGRPVEYAGFDAYYTSGHAFVCDGYNEDFFHFNWGWSGAYDGYFSLNALIPDGTGTGGGSGDFSYGQHVLFGIQPIEEVSIEIPTNLETTDITENSAKLNWDEVESAEKYKIQYKIADEPNWKIRTTTDNFLSIRNLQSETNYVWRVKAIYQNEESDYSETDSFTTLEQICDPIENLEATVTDYQVELNWELSKYAEAISKNRNIKFNIYRNDSFLSTTTNNSYTDKNVEVGTHNYCVEVVYPACTSEQVCVDATVIEIDACTPVQNLTAENVGQTNVIKLTWDTPEGAKNRALTNYVIYLDNEEIANISDVTTTEYIDKTFESQDIDNDYAVSYCIKAVYATCESEEACTDVDVLVGIEDNPDINIYPNPANNLVTISGIKVKTARVYNNTGQLIQEVYGNIIDVSNLRDGIYMITFITEDGNFYKSKLVVN